MYMYVYIHVNLSNPVVTLCNLDVLMSYLETYWHSCIECHQFKKVALHCVKSQKAILLTLSNIYSVFTVVSTRLNTVFCYSVLRLVKNCRSYEGFCVLLSDMCGRTTTIWWAIPNRILVFTFGLETFCFVSLNVNCRFYWSYGHSHYHITGCVRGTQSWKQTFCAFFLADCR